MPDITPNAENTAPKEIIPEKKPPKSRRIFWIVSGVLFLLAVFAAWFTLSSRLDSDRLSPLLNASIKRQIHRDIRFSGVEFSPAEGISIRNVFISERPDFLSGNFISADKIVFKLRIIPLLRRRLIIDEIHLANPKIGLKRGKTGPWNFWDISLMSSGDILVEWKVKKVVLEGAVIDIKDSRSGAFVRIENSRLDFGNYIADGDNLSIASRGYLNGDLAGKKAQGSWVFNGEANFRRSRLISFFGNMEIAEASYADAAVEKAAVRWESFGLERPFSGRKIAMSLKASNCLIKTSKSALPADWRNAERWIVYPVKLLSQIKGVRFPEDKDAAIDYVEAAFSSGGGLIKLKPFYVKSPVFNLDLDCKVYAAEKKISLYAEAGLGDKTMLFKADGPLSGPEMQPEMSYAVRQKIMRIFNDISQALEKLEGEQQAED